MYLLVYHADFDVVEICSQAISMTRTTGGHLESLSMVAPVAENDWQDFQCPSESCIFTSLMFN
jgi:hypothetical protein